MQTNFLAMKKLFTLIAFMMLGNLIVNAQFVPAFPDNELPLNQPCEVTKADGTILKGTLKSAMQMNGRLKSFAVAPDDGSDKQRFKADEVIQVKMKPSNMQKIAEIVRSATDMSKMQNIGDVIDCDWIYYETVKMPNSDKSFLAQRLNPGAANNKLKVYQDPNAKSDASVGFGGMTLIGGKDLSYYILTEGGTNSVLAQSKKYKEQMALIYKDCPSFFTDINGHTDWSQFPKQVALYNHTCK